MVEFLSFWVFEWTWVGSGTTVIVGRSLMSSVYICVTGWMTNISHRVTPATDALLRTSVTSWVRHILESPTSGGIDKIQVRCHTLGRQENEVANRLYGTIIVMAKVPLWLTTDGNVFQALVRRSCRSDVGRKGGRRIEVGNFRCAIQTPTPLVATRMRNCFGLTIVEGLWGEVAICCTDAGSGLVGRRSPTCS